MDNRKYIGMDVHKEAIAIAVLNAAGKLVMESIIETKANTILEFLKGLRGEPTSELACGQLDLPAALHGGRRNDLRDFWLGWCAQRPHSRPVKRVVVCNPRRNALPCD